MRDPQGSERSRSAQVHDAALYAKRDQALILVLLDTGLCASELCALKIGAGVSYQAASSTLDGAPIDLYHAAVNYIEWTGAIGPAQTTALQFRVKAVAVGGEAINNITIDGGAGTHIERSAWLALPHSLSKLWR